jgi:general secretion pathway protein E
MARIEDSQLDADAVAFRERAAAYGLRIVDSPDDVDLDTSLLASLPVEWARTNTVLPVRLDGVAVVLVSDPASIDKQEYVSILAGQSLQPVLAPREVVLACIERCYAQREEKPADLIDNMAASVSSAERQVDDLLLAASGTPITQLINLILLDAFRQRASDIHFEPFETRLRVRFRVDGMLYEQASPPPHVVQALVSRLKVMAHMDIAERRLPQDGMARVRVGEREVDIRVSTVPVSEGERVVLRLLDKSNTLLDMQALGMDEDCFARLRSLLKLPNGMVIVSGPTGSGKTTTLYAALGNLDATRRNILTIEDPIEYQLDNVGQIQVKSKIGLTFSNGLRHILRQDPDVILVGETRDAETAEIAVRASLTGHLVFTTLHTNDAPGAVVRLMDIGVAPYLISACLRGVLAQRLVRRLCPHCRRPVRVEPGDALLLGELYSGLAGQTVWEPVGCDRCTQGYRGRIGLFELLLIDAALRDRIRETGCHLDTIRAAAIATGMKPLLQDGIAKVLAGETSVEDVLSAAAL